MTKSHPLLQVRQRFVPVYKWCTYILMFAVSEVVWLFLFVCLSRKKKQKMETLGDIQQLLGGDQIVLKLFLTGMITFWSAIIKITVKVLFLLLSIPSFKV